MLFYSRFTIWKRAKKKWYSIITIAFNGVDENARQEPLNYQHLNDLG